MISKKGKMMPLGEKEINRIVEIGKEIRLDLFEKLCKVQEGHPGSILSIFDFVNMMYLGGYIQVDPQSNANDAFIMSKGHAAAVQYPYLARLGLIPNNDWDNWGVDQSSLRVFGNRMIPGIDVTSGSLGHGIGIGAGIALANRLDGKKSKVFVVISEGELYEGSTWESLLFLAHHELHEVKTIIDVNRNMILGRPEDCLSLEPIDQKMEAFNLEALRTDGHDSGCLEKGLEFLDSATAKPRVLILNTIKGKGVSFMEDQPESHYWGGLSAEKMEQMLKELAQ